MSLLKYKDIETKIYDGIVIRGTGLHAARCTYLFMKENIPIICYLTKDTKECSVFRNKPVYSAHDNPYGSNYIVVATKPDIYTDIADELRASGKKEFLDFAYYEWFLKDLVLLHGNCHMEILKQFLLSSTEFFDRYAVYPYPLLVSSTTVFRIEPEIFNHIDIWIHEDIREDNIFGFEVSDNYIRRFIKKDVIEIRIPHLYGMGRMFFPQVISLRDGRNEPINDGIDTDGLFLHGDKVIESCLRKGMRLNQIIEFCQSDSAMTKEEILDNYQNCLNKVRAREGSWDIKLSDFIVKEYRKKKLFYDDGHPTNVVMEYVAREVLNILDIHADDLRCFETMDAHEKPVYPCVKKILDLEWDECEIRQNGKKLSDHMDFAEFIREYCYWRHFETFLQWNDKDEL